MTKLHKEAAKITNTFLGFEDHGFFTASLHVDYGGCGQSIGMLALGAEGEDDPKHPMRPTKAGADFIMNVLKACNVKSWEQLKGRNILVLFEDREEHLRNALPIGIEGFAFDGGRQFLFSDFQKRSKYEHSVERHLLKFGMGDVPLNEKLWVPGWKHNE